MSLFSLSLAVLTNRISPFCHFFHMVRSLIEVLARSKLATKFNRIFAVLIKTSHFHTLERVKTISWFDTFVRQVVFSKILTLPSRLSWTISWSEFPIPINAQTVDSCSVAPSCSICSRFLFQPLPNKYIQGGGQKNLQAEQKFCEYPQCAVLFYRLFIQISNLDDKKIVCIRNGMMISSNLKHMKDTFAFLRCTSGIKMKRHWFTCLTQIIDNLMKCGNYAEYFSQFSTVNKWDLTSFLFVKTYQNYFTTSINCAQYNLMVWSS